MKVVLIESRLVEMFLNFYLVIVIWLLEIVINEDCKIFEFVKFLLLKIVLLMLICVFEFIMGNVIDFILFF